METRPSAEAPRPPASSREAPSESALVFAGSSEQDVALAKTFWDSVTLQPHLESCLAPRRGSLHSDAGPAPGSGTGSRRPSNGGRDEERKLGAIQAEKNAMKEQYLKKAKKREEIIALLRKQREERLTKEAHLNRPTKMQER
ncbi:cilia- and flagella-associated protein HOATZ isoform X2 [Anolis carolinensis]|uniref:cilia- and flagella-associated protein HOATZ isoform X2 n=1 Tax=Anolis carolinensis TaxID=28377 RepID=UPI002F2B8D61